MPNQPQYDLLAKALLGLFANLEQTEIRRLFLTMFQDPNLGDLLAIILEDAARTHKGIEALRGNGTAAEQLEAIQVVSGKGGLDALQQMLTACGRNLEFVDAIKSAK